MSTWTSRNPPGPRGPESNGLPSSEFTGIRIDLEKHGTLDLYRIVVRRFANGKPIERGVLGPVGNSQLEDLVAIYTALCGGPEVSPTRH